MKPLIYVATLLFVGILSAFQSTAQTAVPRIVKVGCSEYRAFYLCDNKKVYAALWNNLINGYSITQYDMDGKNVIDLAGGLYHGLAIDADGYAWKLPNKENLATKVAVDNSGNPFTGNVQCDAFIQTNITVKSDGTLWYWGSDDYNFFTGTNAVSTPTPLQMPAGVRFKKVSCGRSLLALTTNGDVYEYANGNPTPIKKTLPRPASDIASGNGFSVAIVPDNITAGVEGWPYGWGPDGLYMGLTTGSNTPVALRTQWGITLPIKKITANHNVIHFIDTDGNLWGMGDNAGGEVGNGEELVNHAEIYLTPYIWDWARNGMMVLKPVHIAVGKQFKDIFTGSSYAFYHYAIATDNTIYSWGRNKALVLGNGEGINQEATFPNALDVLKPTLVNPMQQSVRIRDFKPYTINAGPNRTITLPKDSVVMNGSAVSSSGYSISSFKWTKVSGPSTFTIQDPSSAKTAITGLGVGTYVFRLQMTDNNTGTISDSIVIIVSPATVPINQAPAPNAGADQKKSLPANSVDLDGSASYDPDGTIVAWQWTKISGPASFNIASPNTAKTSVTGLVEGIYNFELTVTDDKGATNKDVVVVTIAANLEPVARAGNDITIMLPTNSVSLNGSSSSDPDGTIAAWQWVKISGPASFNIASPNTANTSVSGLVEGVYNFELTVTDDKGATSRDVVIVTVDPYTPPPNQSPVARAGIDITIALPANSVNLDGSNSSDPDGTIVTWQWNKIAGPTSFNISSPGSSTTTVTGLVEGVYSFELTVTDDKGATGKDVIMVTVSPKPNEAPVAKAGDDVTITLPDNAYTLDGSASYDPDGTIVSYHWIKISGPSPFTMTNPNTVRPSLVSLLQGVYELELTVTDDKGATAKDRVLVTVQGGSGNKSPVAKAGDDQTIQLPKSSADLNGSGSTDEDGTIQAYQWQQVSGPSNASIGTPNAAKTSVSGLAEGTYEFELTVTDDKGAQGTDRLVILVSKDGSHPEQDSVCIYPVPVRTTMTVSITGTSSGKASITIYSTSGHMVLRKEFVKSNSVHLEKIDLSHLQAGCYAVIIQTPDGRKLTKMINKL